MYLLLLLLLLHNKFQLECTFQYALLGIFSSLPLTYKQSL